MSHRSASSEVTHNPLAQHRESTMTRLPAYTPLGGNGRFGPRATLRLTPGEPGRALATITGEVDAECTPDLERCLTSALRHYPEGLELDLSAVSFFDCAGLNALLKARTTDPAGHHLTIRTMSRRVARVLELTGSQDLLALRP